MKRNAPNHCKRIAGNHGTTMIHGDMNVCNLLLPLDQGSDPVLIDLEAVRVGVPTEDLVALLILDLFHDAEQTLALFKTYHQSLNSKITGRYRVEQFEEDIRMSLTEGLFYPLKLFSQLGIEDEDMIRRSIRAWRSMYPFKS